MKLKIYGSSDDLIEIEGDYREEFSGNTSYAEPAFLIFSDGTVIKVYYEKNNMAIWGVEIFRQGEALSTRKECDHENADIYSDIVELEGDFKWVIFSNNVEIESIK